MKKIWIFLLLSKVLILLPFQTLHASDSKIKAPDVKITEKFYANPWAFEVSDKELESGGISSWLIKEAKNRPWGYFTGNPKDTILNLAIKHIDAIAKKAEGTDSKDLETKGIVYAFGVQLIAQAGHPDNSTPLLYSPESPDLENMAYLSGKNFFDLAEHWKKKDDLQKALNFYCVSLKVLRLPINSEEETLKNKKKFHSYYYKIACLAEQSLEGIQAIVSTNKGFMLPPPQQVPLEEWYFAPSQEGQSDTFSLILWRIDCLDWARRSLSHSSPPSQSQTSGEPDFLKTYAPQKSALCHQAIPIVLEDVLKSEDLLIQAEYLTIARNLAFRAFEAFQLVLTKNHHSVRENAYKQYVHYSEKTGSIYTQMAQIIKTTIGLSSPLFSKDNPLILEKKQTGARYLLRAAQLIWNVGDTDEQKLAFYKKGLTKAKEAEQTFGLAACQELSSYYAHNKAPSIDETEDRQSLTDHIQNKILDHLKKSFFQQHPNGFDSEMAKNQTIQTFLQNHHDTLGVMSPKYTEALQKELAQPTPHS